MIYYIKLTELPIVDRYSSGSSITKGKISDAFVQSLLVKKDDIKKDNVVKEDKKTTLEDIDKKIYTIDDFLETIEFLD